MANKHLIEPPSSVILQRLTVLLEDVNDAYKSDRMVLEQDVINLYHQAMDTFLESLDKSIVGVVYNLYSGAPTDPIAFNAITDAILKDLRAVFLEIGALDKMMSASFNSLIAERESALQISKKISNKLGDYLLYADPSLGGGFFFGDSFNSTDRLEISSPLVEVEECFHSPEEGVILLPLDGEPDIPKVKSIIINKPSNGVSGSNAQLDVFGHNEINVISDSEPNTWFEYEKVTVNESNTPLILDLTMTLDDSYIINHININPVNFGTPTPVDISVIETSEDGKEFVSILDEIPVKDFVTEDNMDDFVLSSSSSKYSGQGFYSFLPRKVRFIHIVLEQHTPYSIETLNGSRLRYAIGIRDINILGRRFKTEGSIISTPFSINGDIRKISLWASENPTEVSVLADISHSISYDDGASWLQIQPQGRDAFGVPEVINFNNIADGAIATENTVDTLRHKISMLRNPDEFKGNAVLKQEKKEKLDIVSAPAGGEFTVSLTEQPIIDTVSVIQPFWGSFSCPRPRVGDSVAGQSAMMDLDFVEFSVAEPETGTIRYKLPFRGIPNIQDKIRVFVNGEQWEWMSKDETILDNPTFSSSSVKDGSGKIHSGSKVYFLNRSGLEIQFGLTDSSGVARGKIPPAGAKIQICLDGDNPLLRLTDKGYVLNLSAPSDGIREGVSIVAFQNLEESEAEDYLMELTKGSLQYIDDTGLLYTRESTNNKPEKATVSVAEKGTDSVGITKAVSPSSASSAGNQTQSTRKPGAVSGRSSSGLSSSQSSFQQISTIKEVTYEPGTTESIDKTVNTSTFFALDYEGLFPPVFIKNTSTTSTPNNFKIQEYDLDTDELITGASRQFTTPVTFVDGYSELLDSSGNKVSSRYTFDTDTGAVFLGSEPKSSVRTILFAKRLRAKIVPLNLWSYDRDTATDKVDTKKIILDPRAVFTVKRTKEFSIIPGTSERSISLISANEPGHDWFNKHVVQGTVKLDRSLFSNGAEPVEVPFVDGQSELNNVVTILDEDMTLTSIGGNQYTYTLQEIDTLTKSIVGSPGFAPVRTETSASTPVSQFTEQIASTASFTTDGQWKLTSSGGSVTITLYLTSGTPNSHTVTYKYKTVDSGVDISGLYSVDYYNGVVHFAEPVADSGNISFEVSVYSLFYNIGKPVSSDDIEEISEENSSITFSSAFGFKFLKQDLASSSRPQFLKVMYKYYEKSLQSLEDLEPYFSPICKDIAFRAITSDILEEL